MQRLLDLLWRVVVALAAAITVYLGLLHFGLTTPIWRNWLRIWVPILVIVFVVFEVLTTVRWSTNDEIEGLKKEQHVTGITLMAIATITALKLDEVVGAIAWGALLATTVVSFTISAWMEGWREGGHGTRHDHLLLGLASHGEHAWGALHGALSSFVRGPRSASARASRSMPWVAQIAGGVIAFILLWTALSIVGAGLAWATATAAHAGSPETKASTSNESDETPSTLTCSSPIGSGPDVTRTVRDSARQAATQAEELGLKICGTDDMAYDDGLALYRQQVFGADGVGVLLVWSSSGSWIATLLTGDDVRGYKRITDSAGWQRHGHPYPFTTCDGLWIQPFRSLDGTLEGIGVRRDVDQPSKGDEPIFMWGSDVEALLARTRGQLALPAGQPTSDASGPIQHLFNVDPVRSEQTPATTLTVEDLLVHCGG